MNDAISTTERRRQRDAFQMAFSPLGYEEDCIRFDWRFSSLERNNGRAVAPGVLDVALFHDPREQDYSTIAMVVELGRQDLVRDKVRGKARARELFERTVAPHVALGGNATTDVWIDCHEDPIPIADVAMHPDAILRALEQHRSKLERAALIRLRGGQGFLFDRIYTARREELAASLNEGFSRAVESHPSVWVDDKRRALLSRAAIAILAARILEDKKFLTPSTRSAAPKPHTDARRLLEAVERRADGFFTQVLKDLDAVTKERGATEVDVALQSIMAHLTGPICFSLVTPDMLGHLYESALIPERVKSDQSSTNATNRRARPKDNWIHYTPLSLTKHILRRLPLEEIRQDQRRVLDMACGSGTFLLAATERLSALYDVHEDASDQSRLAHLRSRVIGYDLDPVALLVTKLTYLVAHWIATASMVDVPEPTSEKRDARTLTAKNIGATRPTVIVGNPPFESGKTQLANQFLGKAIELLAPGGLLGMILPLGFLKMKREGCPAMRRSLLEACDLLEVWELPVRAIGLHARQETCVILARRHGGIVGRPAATLFKQTHSEAATAVRAMKDDLRSARTFAASGPPLHPGESWSIDPQALLVASPLEAVWQKIGFSRSLGGLCVGHKGIDMTGASSFSREPVKGMFPYMRRQAQLRPYGIARIDWCLPSEESHSQYNYVDPSPGLRPRLNYWPFFNCAKVVVTMRGSRNKRHQLVAAFDPTFDGNGVFPEHDFSCFGIWQDSAQLAPWARSLVQERAPRTILVWVAAVLSSPVAQAWVAMRAAARGLSDDDIATLPMPQFDPEVADIAERIIALDPKKRATAKRACWALSTAEAPEKSSASFEALAGYLNHRIAASYELNDDDVQSLKSYLREMTDQWVDAPADAHLARLGVAYRRISGTVVAVDVVDQEMELDLPRYRQDGPVAVPLPRHIPGWALAAGVEFTCSVPVNSQSVDDLRDPWHLRDFMPVPYSYLSTEELEKLIGYERPSEPADGK